MIKEKNVEDSHETIKFNNKKKIILGSIIGVLIGSLISVSYAFFTFSKTSNNNSQLIAGDIYMKYGESNQLELSNAMPSETYDSSKYFEFTITGKNTYSKPIIYDISIIHGDNHATRTRRLADKFLKFTLIKEETGKEPVTVVDGKSYSDFSNGTRIAVGTIPANQNTEITYTYKLYMWIDGVIIGNVNQDYTIAEWNEIFASVKVNVTGDFEEKEVGVTVSKKIQQLATSTSYVKNYTTDYINNSSYTYNGTRFNTQDTVGENTNKKDVYYFTGDDAVTYGNVLFGGFCWQIIRTTDTGGVKLIYNGVAENNQCLTTRANGKGINGVSGTQKTTMTAATKYGTGFTYDLTSGQFTLTGVMDKTWANNASELTGTYTCLSGETSCTTLYYVGHYQSATEASTASYTIGDNDHYSQIGKSAYNAYYDSLALVGYMYNKAYVYAENAKTGNHYANSVTYLNGVYTLVNPTEEVASAPTAGKQYVCDGGETINGDTITCQTPKVRFYYYNNYHVVLENGDTNPVYTMLNGKNQGETEDADINKYNSAIKGLLDNWYKQNIDNQNAIKGLIDTSAVYCNDRSSSNNYGSWNKDAANLTTYLYFKQNSTNMDLRCENITDRFAVGNEKANLVYPVGLLTEPERGLMGSTYAKSGQYYWGASPYYFYYYIAYVRDVSSSGVTSNDYTSYSRAARPVVTLRLDAEIEEGEGTYESPYVIGPKIVR